MLIKHILTNLLIYFLPVLVVWIIALATKKVSQTWKRRGNWLCLVVFAVVVVFSVLTSPSPEPLKIELAFYALHEVPDSTYSLVPLVGSAEATLLGIEDSLDEIRGMPVVYSGDRAQMRIRPNRRCFVYVHQFDTALSDPRQLFPSQDIAYSNPVSPDVWAELPIGEEVWTFDQQPGVEIFVVSASVRGSTDIVSLIHRMVARARESSGGWYAKLDGLREELRLLGLCTVDGAGVYHHNMVGVTPPSAKSFIYTAHDDETAVRVQMVLHRP